MNYRHCIGLFVLVAGLLCGISAQDVEIRSIGKPASLTKEYIDSLVTRGIYILGEAAATGDVGLTRREAITQANAIADKLRIQAETDPNRAYILWKVRELEWQITLEEKDIVLRKVKFDGQASVSQVSADFNRELAKERPDFKDLVRMQARMKELDAQRAEEMGRSIINRSVTISRLAMVSLEESLMYGNEAEANEEYRYCLRNRAYLAIPREKFGRLESRLSQCAQANDGLAHIEAEADSADTLLSRVEPGAARSKLASARYRHDEIRAFIAREVAAAIAARLSSLEKRLNRCEDSLVAVNLEILKRKGPDEAGNYLEAVVHRLGVRPEKAALVDREILAAPAAGRSRPTGAASAVSGVTEAAPESTWDRDVFAEMREQAVRKVRARQDSVRALDSARQRAETARLDSMETAARTNAERELQEKRDQALQTASEIYSLIKNDRTRAAYDSFDGKKAILRQYLPADAFALLESTVIQIINPQWGIESGSIMMLAARAPVQEKAPTGDAIASPDAGNRKKALAAIEDIYSLIEKNRNRAAVDRFESEKPFLKTYLGKEEYEMLVMSVAVARGTR